MKADMNSSRENSPDWLRCFQAPTRSTLVLSSDSEHSHDGSPTKEDRTGSEEVSLSKSSKVVEDDENLGKTLGESGARSPSNKKSRLKSLKKKSLKKLSKFEDEMPSEENESDRPKKRKGDDRGGKVAKKLTVESPSQSHARSVWSLSSDSELSPENSPRKEDQKIPEEIGEGEDTVLIGRNEDAPSKKASKDKLPRKELLEDDDKLPRKELQEDDDATIKEKKKRSMKIKGNQGDVEVKEEEAGDVEVKEEEALEKKVDSHVSSARLPLILSEKVQRSKALVECDGDSIDLGGDVGAVGRIMVSDTPSGDQEMYLDMKGTIYKTTIVPSRTFCVVSFGPSEAKIEAIMNDFIQLKPQSNVFEAETMVEGTLDGFLFDSDEEAGKLPKAASNQTGQNEDAEEKANGKAKGKAEKTSGIARKKGKTAGGKPQPQKKVKKKAPVSKKAKTKK